MRRRYFCDALLLFSSGALAALQLWLSSFVSFRPQAIDDGKRRGRSSAYLRENRLGSVGLRRVIVHLCDPQYPHPVRAEPSTWVGANRVHDGLFQFLGLPARARFFDVYKVTGATDVVATLCKIGGVVLRQCVEQQRRL